MTQAVNPYLPSYEYIPDGEPRVVDGRVYVYGSHDRFGAPMFCVNDYVCWSAPVEDLSSWRYESVIYKQNQDPLNRRSFRSLYAPDMVQGPDGRFYLYYAFDFMGVMGVAVCDTPAGRYEYLGHIRFPDGREWGSRSGDEFPFDPGVLVDDDGRVYLYSGFQTKVPFFMSRFRNLKNTGCVVMELEKDMMTIRKGPTLMLPFTHRIPAATLEPCPTDDTEWALLTLGALVEGPDRPTGESLLAPWLERILPDAENVRTSFSERATIDNLRRGLRPPATGNDNPMHYADSAVPRGAVAGLFAPGDVETAAEIARLDACITQAEDGVCAAQAVLPNLLLSSCWAVSE